jgi:hypothetical protein
VVHATFGRTWTPEIFNEDLDYIREVAKNELTHFFGVVNEAHAIAFSEGKI